jgi:peptidase E
VVLCGVSAGSLCWFASGLTAYHHEPKPYEGLGFLPHSNAVHYEQEPARRPAYHAALLDGSLPAGYAASDGAALHFVGTGLHRVVLSRPDGRAYRVEAAGDEVVELPLEATYLGDRPPIALAA